MTTSKRSPLTHVLSEVKKPMRASAAGDHQVQVKATPVNNRFRDVFVTTSTESHGLFGDGQSSFRQPQLLGHHTQTEHHNFVSASPLAGRIQATPMRASSTSVPDSAIKAVSALPSRDALVATAGNTLSASFSRSRSSALQSFPEEEETILASSPIATRRARHPPSTQPLSFDKSYGKAVVSSVRQANATRTYADADMIPGSSPLQARSQPRMSTAIESVHVFETPTKARAIFREEITFATSTIMATPPPVRPAAVGPVPAGGMANSVQSLYQQMGWDDDLDDLA